MLLSAVAGTILAAAFANWRFALGVALGGGLALLNFRWLEGSLRQIFAVGSPRVPPGTTIKFAFRWMIIGGIGYAASWTGIFDSHGIVTGLLAPAAAALFEAGYMTVASFAAGETPADGPNEI